mmetsp:Transcript_39824/g.101005  ORF Transcript_39824/g.101005 Transcript_39824/m.101005 type:complete len:354 (-) Transcript_39824:370-1431(-)
MKDPETPMQGGAAGAVDGELGAIQASGSPKAEDAAQEAGVAEVAAAEVPAAKSDPEDSPVPVRLGSGGMHEPSSVKSVTVVEDEDVTALTSLRLAPIATTQDKEEPHKMTIDDMFVWLRWSPDTATPCGKTLARCFHGAMPGTPVLRRTIDVLQALDSSIVPPSVLYGQSICPDEINNEEGDLSTIMANHWGEVFPMGGIGGAPYVGKTGFGAFSHHVPENGHVLVLFGPHIAVSEAGELGKYTRVGQHCESSACGAVLAAYNACRAGEVNPHVMDMMDMQQCWLRQKVHSHYEEIEEAPEPLKVLIRKTYDEIEKLMLEIANHDFGEGKLILLGGIQVRAAAMPTRFARTQW